MNEPKDKTYEVPECACPTCRAKINRADISPIQNKPRAPQKGDVAVCMTCGAINEYTRNGKFDLELIPCKLDSFLDMTVGQVIEVLMISTRVKVQQR